MLSETIRTFDFCGVCTFCFVKYPRLGHVDPKLIPRTDLFEQFFVSQSERSRTPILQMTTKNRALPEFGGIASVYGALIGSGWYGHTNCRIIAGVGENST